MRTVTIVVKPLDPPSFSVTLPLDWKLSDLESKIPAEKLRAGNWVIGIAEAEDIIWNDKNTTTRNKINEKKVITQLLRAQGGDDMQKFCTKMIAESVNKLGKQYKKIEECSVCCATKMCYFLHDEDCGACADCFSNHFTSPTNVLTDSIKCLCDSKRILPIRSLVERGVDEAIQTYINLLNESRKCNRLMQFQVHKCGASVKLTGTTYSKQKCDRCKETFCFFCNADWTPDRTNNEYTCGKNCTYETMLAVKLVPWKYPGTIPAWRYCPNCITPIQYAGACKNHRCLECQHWFCFFCLTPTGEAEHKFNQPCPVKIVTLKELFDASIKTEKFLASN